jgi:hypothetical protein
MRGFRFHLGTLMIVVMFLGVGFAALRESHDLWESGVLTLMIGVVLISTLLAGTCAIVVRGKTVRSLNQAQHSPARVQSPDGLLEQHSSDISPLMSLVLYLCSQAAEINEIGAGKRVETRPVGK